MSTVEVKTSELIGPALDWAVAHIEGYTLTTDGISMLVKKGDKLLMLGGKDAIGYSPSTRWDQGGPLIEEHGIEVFCNVSAEQAARFKEAYPDWRACMNRGRSVHFHGRTPLIAAMRCLVAAKLGDTVQVPEELLT